MVNNFYHLVLLEHTQLSNKIRSFNYKITENNNSIFFSSGRSSCNPQGVVMDYMTAVVAVTQVLV